MDKKPPLTVSLGIPIDCGHRHEFWISLTRTLAMAPQMMAGGGSLNFIYNPGDSLICRARNNIAHDFLMNPCLGQAEYLFFIDTDISFEPEQFFRLLSHRTKGIVCGQYMLKQAKPQFCYNTIAGEKADKSGLMKVREAGTGFMLIHRNVFKIMKDKLAPSHYYKCDMHKDMRFSFFDAGVVNGRYQSEDWLFCNRATALGIPVHIDTKILVGHHGWASYPQPPAPPEAKEEKPKKKKKNGIRRSHSKR